MLVYIAESAMLVPHAYGGGPQVAVRLVEIPVTSLRTWGWTGLSWRVPGDGLCVPHVRVGEPSTPVSPLSGLRCSPHSWG